MKIVKLTDEHKQIYSESVAAHDSGSFLQSWGWGEFQTTQGRPVVRYAVFDDSGSLIATASLLQTKVPHLPGFYLYAPYGPLVASSLADGEAGQIVSALLGQIKIDFPKAWFIRLEPKQHLELDKVVAQQTVHIQPGATLITALSASEEELLARMHPKTRYNIKVAEKHGVAVSSELELGGQSNLQIQAAVKLLVDTSRRQGYKAQSSAYYEQLLNYFALHHPDGDCQVKLYKAMHDGKCVASSIVVDHGKTRTYLFGGSDNSQRALMAPYALHWQAMRDARAAGFSAYDWWGTETATGKSAGFVQFKLRWGGKQITYPAAVDIVQNNKWYSAYKALRKINRFL
jgi:peptidoglycan pentaglycine glycine transferase (the first glycine)